MVINEAATGYSIFKGYKFGFMPGDKRLICALQTMGIVGRMQVWYMDVRGVHWKKRCSLDLCAHLLQAVGKALCVS